ncbi:MAG: DUF1934 domain-containing protein [Oscillospiraceae bacterium]|nr:DUF1934 domain-containing protein [Oscillospiraceae bacterium]
MEKNVIISVRGTQTVGGNSSGVMELMTEGMFYRKDNSYYLAYNESGQYGFDDANTMIEISDGTLKFIRFGMINAQFIFQQGKKYISHYDTPHGSFTFCVFTNNINIDVDDNGGVINIDYMLELENGPSALNDFYVRISEPGKKPGVQNEHFFKM